MSGSPRYTTRPRSLTPHLVGWSVVGLRGSKFVRFALRVVRWPVTNLSINTKRANGQTGNAQTWIPHNGPSGQRPYL